MSAPLFDKPKVAPRGTRLAHALRIAVGKATSLNEFAAQRILMHADRLDSDARNLGARGEKLKLLSAYSACLRFYREVVGKPYGN